MVLENVKEMWTEYVSLVEVVVAMVMLELTMERIPSFVLSAKEQEQEACERE